MLNVNLRYESSRNSHDIFCTLISIACKKCNHHKVLHASWFETPLGPMIAIGDEKNLYLLEFFDRRYLERKIEILRCTTQATIISGVTDPINSIIVEIQSYFNRTLTEFKTPLHLGGTSFQKAVWQELIQIPYGQTRTYKTQAEALGKATAYRAVANANGANQLAIVIPCHRIIKSDGGLGGYGSGITRKQWLIDHEKEVRKCLI